MKVRFVLVLLLIAAGIPGFAGEELSACRPDSVGGNSILLPGFSVLDDSELERVDGGEVIFVLNSERTTLRVIYVNERTGRETLQGSYAVSNRVRDRENPDVLTCPAAGESRRNYYPSLFPAGEYQITGVVEGRDASVFGNTPLSTNACQYVETYSNLGSGYKKDKNMQMDYGYMIHAGKGDDYTAFTWGCIRTTNESLKLMAASVRTEQYMAGMAGRDPRPNWSFRVRGKMVVRFPALSEKTLLGKTPPAGPAAFFIEG